jgi:UMF1 family MFS transporter
VKSWLAARPALSWALYDWANSAFATTVMAGFFPAFFRQFWSQGVDSSVTTFRLGMANASAGLAIALLAPLLGAIADRGGRRKQMLLVFSLLGITTTFVLYFVAQGQWLAAAALFALGTLGFNGGVVFCDALLLDVARPVSYTHLTLPTM